MSTQGPGSPLNRRRFLQRSLALGAGVAGLELLAACGGASSTTTTVSATVNTLPPSTNPGAVYVFNQVVKDFEQAYPHEHIIGKNDPYDPTTYFAKLAAGQLEDGIQSYFTEPPLLIARHAVADITSLAKSWPSFKDYIPSIASIVTRGD